jgi:hypothetical protein
MAQLELEIPVGRDHLGEAVRGRAPSGAAFASICDIG